MCLIVQGTLQHILAKRTSELFAALQAKERKKGHEAQTHRASLVAIERHGRFAVLLIISNKRGKRDCGCMRYRASHCNSPLQPSWRACGVHTSVPRPARSGVVPIH